MKDILNQIKEKFGGEKYKGSVDHQSLTGLTSNSRIKKKIKGGGGHQETPWHDKNKDHKQLLEKLLKAKEQ